MDLVRSFTDSGLASGFNVNIQGSVEDPLFQANQIGELLGLANIHESIKDFDETEKGFSSTDTPGGKQTTVFLTDLGLVRLLGMSRKPVARPFQKWVGRVIKEIRLTGKYETEKLLDQAVKALEDAKKDAKGERHNALVNAYAGRPLFYLGQIGSLPDGRLVIKYGETDDVFFRARDHQKKYGGFILLNVYPCTQPHALEQWLASQREFVMRRYDGLVNGCRGREYLAVPTADYPSLSRFIKANVDSRGGWSADQQRYTAVRDVRLIIEGIPDALKALASFENLDARRKAEAVIADSLSTALNRRLCDDIANCCVDVNYGSMPRVTDEDEMRPPEMDQSPGAALVSPMPKLMPQTQPTQQPDLFPPPPKKKMGRPPKPRPVQASFSSQGNLRGLPGFLSECFVEDADAITLVALVRARYRLWTRGASSSTEDGGKNKKSGSREETTELVAFFEQRFQKANVDDKDRMMTNSYYKGVSMKPWAPPTPSAEAYQVDVDAFVREKCEAHVMVRATTADLMSAFAAWKKKGEPGQEDEPFTYKERQRILGHLEAAFVRSMVPVTMAGTCSPGFFGVYLNDATAECRDVGYNRSPNTRAAVVKLDARGNVVQVLDSLHELASGVLGKSNQYVCKLLGTCFAVGMKGLVHSDGYEYMRAKDYETRKNAAVSASA